MIVDGLATQGVIQGDKTSTGLALKMRASYFPDYTWQEFIIFWRHSGASFSANID